MESLIDVMTAVAAASVRVEPAAGTHTLPIQSPAAPTIVDKTQTMPAAMTIAADDANLQRTQSARYPPEKRPESKSPLVAYSSSKRWKVSG